MLCLAFMRFPRLSLTINYRSCWFMSDKEDSFHDLSVAFYCMAEMSIKHPVCPHLRCDEGSTRLLALVRLSV